jgi:hypothetical protein
VLKHQEFCCAVLCLIKQGLNPFSSTNLAVASIFLLLCRSHEDSMQKKLKAIPSKFTPRKKAKPGKLGTIM